MSTRVTHDGKRWSNADQDRIGIQPYDRSWPAQFHTEAAAIRSALGESFSYSVEHVGSTAIPGLSAKPLIDIIVALPDRDRWPSLVSPLQQLGYVYWDDNPDKNKMFFVKGMPPFGTGRTHHIHVHTPEGAAPVLQFRDYLIAHPEAAVRYEALKRDLAIRYANDRDAYTNAKAEFVRQVLRKAGALR